MAQVFPFRAFRYNSAVVPFSKVLTQPYDKISPTMQDQYYAADSRNLITVEKGRAYPEDSASHNVYTRAAASLDSWIQQQVIVRSEEHTSELQSRRDLVCRLLLEKKKKQKKKNQRKK